MKEPQQPEINVDGIIFRFQEGWSLAAFDRWPQFTKIAGAFGAQGCDILALKGDELWFIEVKDYTFDGAETPTDLPTTVAKKTIGTLATICALAKSREDTPERSFSRRCLTAKRYNLALHIELKDGGLKDKMNKPLLATLKQELRKIRKKLEFADHALSNHWRSSDGLPWTAARDPRNRPQHCDR
ncbi:hypothetical protein [Corynebacterium singulare]|uniref:Uncharacterized protein n=1 Tax=Corynebacterium singulare TaxID=161899 RepID=A0A0B6F2E3_9CORY|nr:hypothetical protein [Corynebacterium singulare]AJI78206.1 hypothetical protein CSING_03280 [Corynebacterium singulare]